MAGTHRLLFPWLRYFHQSVVAQKCQLIRLKGQENVPRKRSVGPFCTVLYFVSRACRRAFAHQQFVDVLQPADLQLYHKSTEKRGRAAISQTPDTPAKAETKADTAKNLGLKQAKEADRPESPLLELSDGEELFADTDASIEIAQATRIKVRLHARHRQEMSGVICAVLMMCFSQVLQHELHHIKQEVMMSKQAAAQAQAEKGQLDAEVSACSLVQTVFTSFCSHLRAAAKTAWSATAGPTAAQAAASAHWLKH